MVLDWFRRRDKLPSDAIPANSECGAFLLAEAAKLEPLGSKIARRVGDQLLTGRDVAVLEALRRQPRGAELLNLKQQRYGNAMQIYDLHHVDRPDGLVRLGEVYAACLPDAAFGHLGKDVPRWLECVLWQGSNHSPFGGTVHPARVRVSARRAAAALELAEDPVAILVHLAMQDPRQGGSGTDLTRAMHGLGDYLVEEHALVAEILQDDSASRLRDCLTVLTDSQADITTWRPYIATLAVDARKTVHELATALLGDPTAADLELWQRLSTEGKPPQRRRATALLSRIESQSRDSAPDAPSTEIECPSREPLPPLAPLTDAERQAIQTFAAAIETSRERRRDQMHEWEKRHTTDASAALTSIGTTQPWSEKPTPSLWCGPWADSDQALAKCRTATSWHLGHWLRLLFHTQGHGPFPVYLLSREVDLLGHHVGRRFDLRDVAEAIAWTHCGKEYLATKLCDDQHEFGWEADRIWPYFFAHQDVLVANLRFKTYDRVERREYAMRILAMFPQLPAASLPDLWDMALGTAKRSRSLAQDVLAAAPDRNARVLAALGDGKQDVRAVAARWLGAMGDPANVPAIEKALEKEKSDVAKAAMFTALERLGRSVEKYLDRDALATEAAKGLQKPPKGLEPLLTLELPDLHWSDGSLVDPVIAKWWLLKSGKLKDPAPDALLRRYLASVQSADREAFGEALLARWIEEDTRKPDQLTRLDERRLTQEAKDWESYFTELTFEEILADRKREFLDNPQGSAIKLKGALGLVAACGGPALAPLVERYLREWYGLRAPQCKALLRMLAWVDDDAAIQVLLATSTRFRTAGIRKEAEALVLEVAERRGWTPDELADRTLPFAGFDEFGTQTVAYFAQASGEEQGPTTREFELRLADDLSIEVAQSGGSALKNLPKPREDEDGADAKKALSRSKKALKQIVKQQEQRLYEAMCAERSWPAADWRTFLLAHPIVGRLCRRVVWATGRSGSDSGEIQVFRPTDDGRCTDLAGHEIELGDDQFVRIAHTTLLAPEAAMSWQLQSIELGLDPLIDQFPSKFAALPLDLETEDRIDCMHGHVISAFTLRNVAKKRGFLRGPAEDAAYFYSYQKPFPRLGFDAVLEFTGNQLPEEDRDCALLSAYFEKRTPSDSVWVDRPKLPLAALPRVLLREFAADLGAIVDAGEGYRDDWQERTEH